jgi:hypothetical protein
MRYGELPSQLGLHFVNCHEMMFYQYLPIKLSGMVEPKFEERLFPFSSLMGVICCDFVGTFGIDRYVKSNIYVTAKRLFQTPGCAFNRPGYHSDGFMTDDINYIWSDCNPTIFNRSKFALTLHDSISLVEMEAQACKENEVKYDDCVLLRLNQFNIHKVGEIEQPGLRTFLKVSFSIDKYNLIGNSHNHLLDYNWEMIERKFDRNIPQQ